MNQYTRLVWLLFASFIFISCQSQGPASPSVLLIAVESLPVDAVNCVNVEGSEDSDSGFQVLCRESVRYTHAFTPSPLSQSAIASLFTGLWPFEHKVRTNGAPGLSAHFETIAEIAYTQGYKTSFFSGGPPILRKSGLAQGFEVFEDNFPVSWSQLHRSSDKLITKFLEWLDEDVGADKFLSVLYFSDLQSFDLPAADIAGVPIDRSYEGRKARLDRQLFKLFETLKQQKHWSDTYVILVGLNGYSDQERFNEVVGTNLHAENTQVAMLIKGPQSKARDLSLHWGVDANVTLVDLGETLRDVLGGPVSKDSTFLNPVSLKANLNSPDVYWDAERPLLLESAWAKWRGFGEIRYAVRFGSSLYIHNQRPALYNSLSDRLETSPLFVEIEKNKKVSEILNHVSAEPWSFTPFYFLNRLDVGLNLWDPSRNKGVLQEDSKEDEELGRWVAAQALVESQWQELLKLGQLHNRLDWQYVAGLNLGTPFAFNEQAWRKSRASPCWRALFSQSKNVIKQCEDPLFVDIYTLSKMNSNLSEYHSQRESIARTFYQLRLDRKISQMNFVNGLNWDTQYVKVLEPSSGELLLSLPDNRKLLAYCNEKLLIDKKDE